MGSSFRTPYLNLNKFVGTDKPKMDDFNNDNDRIDCAFKNHEEDMDVHVSLEEKKLWNSGAFIMGTYQGDGKEKRTIDIGFKARLCIIFQVNAPLVSYDSQTNIHVQSAILSEKGCTQYANLTENGFTVENLNTSSPFGSAPKLNSIQSSYVYIAYK